MIYLLEKEIHAFINAGYSVKLITMSTITDQGLLDFALFDIDRSAYSITYSIIDPNGHIIKSGLNGNQLYNPIYKVGRAGFD